jgi:hypothetical protein
MVLFRPLIGCKGHIFVVFLFLDHELGQFLNEVFLHLSL